MGSTDNLPALTKASVQLQTSITQLLQQASHGWLEAAQQISSAGLDETAAQIEELLGARDWAALMALPFEILSRNAPYQAGGPQALTQTAVREQILFINGLQRALPAWQQAVWNVLDGDDRASAFVEWARQSWRPWTGNATATEKKE